MKPLKSFILILSILLWVQELKTQNSESDSAPFVIVLGTAQDGGFPHPNCLKNCCAPQWDKPAIGSPVSCIALVDPVSRQFWFFDATPDFPLQLAFMQQTFGSEFRLAGIFLTHAHMGHYTGLMYLGREAMGADAVPVYAMPRMSAFLKENGPWSQLVELQNIKITEISTESPQVLIDGLNVQAFQVPHRDEFSETVGYEISTPNQSALFIPDIDKWSVWDEDIREWIKRVDIAFLDATFYDNKEIPNRDISEIPHPFVVESMELFESLSKEDRSKVHFIHLNHSNPLLNSDSPEFKKVISQGFNIARPEMSHALK